MTSDTLQALANECLCLLQEKALFPALLSRRVEPCEEISASVRPFYITFVFSANEQQWPLIELHSKYLIPASEALAYLIDDTIADHLVASSGDWIIAPPSKTVKACLDLAAEMMPAPEEDRSLVLEPGSEVAWLKSQWRAHDVNALRRDEELAANVYMTMRIKDCNAYFHKNAVELISYRPPLEDNQAWAEYDDMGIRLTVTPGPKDSVTLNFDVPMALTPVKPGHCILIPPEHFQP